MVVVVGKPYEGVRCILCGRCWQCSHSGNLCRLNYGLTATERLSEALLQYAADTNPPPGPNVLLITTFTVAAVVILLAATGSGLAIWRFRQANRYSGQLTRSVISKWRSSTQHQNLKVELDKKGDPILLGKGTFGEVSLLLLKSSKSLPMSARQNPRMRCFKLRALSV